MTAPTRPALRYHGGKWLLAPWVISHFPKHRLYVEPYGGAASVLLRKPRSYAEIWSDLSDDLVTLFAVLRDDAAAPRLVDALRLTPFARSEFRSAYGSSDDPVERARRLIVRSFQGFGSDGCNPGCPIGFRKNAHRNGSTAAQDWANYPDALARIIERFRSVMIESRDGVQVMIDNDGPDTLHYCDPPYVPATRGLSGRARRGKTFHTYEHELEEADHVALAEVLRGLKGYVVLSGYPSRLYEDLFHDWHSVSRDAFADGALRRTETLWINTRAWRALHGEAGPLFERRIPA